MLSALLLIIRCKIKNIVHYQFQLRQIEYSEDFIYINFDLDILIYLYLFTYLFVYLFIYLFIHLIWYKRVAHMYKRYT